MNHKSVLNEVYTLSNGVEIPKVGLGTWFIADDVVSNAICEAIKIGYRHIDTAQAYGNEVGIGLGIKTSGISRDEIFVTSKIAAEAKDYDSATKAIDESLRKLGLAYIDLMLIHSPQPWSDFRGGNYNEGNQEAWRALEDAYKAGKLRSIGVSNFNIEDLENIFESCSIKPMVNQLLVHIGNTPVELINHCNKHHILVEAYSPVAHGQLLKSAEIAAIAEKYNVSLAQLCIKYCLQIGTLPIPKTANVQHMMENITLDFDITSNDMEKLKTFESLNDYGEFSVFPVFSGK